MKTIPLNTRYLGVGQPKQIRHVHRSFFARAREVNGLPRKIVIDKSGANTVGIKAINKMLKSFGCPILIETVRLKYLNNIIEQDHRFIKRRIRLMLGFKSLVSAASVLAGIELANMIRKGQFAPGLRPFQKFIQLVGYSPLKFRLYNSQRNLRQNPRKSGDLSAGQFHLPQIRPDLFPTLREQFPGVFIRN